MTEESQSSFELSWNKRDSPYKVNVKVYVDGTVIKTVREAEQEAHARLKSSLIEFGLL